MKESTVEKDDISLKILSTKLEEWYMFLLSKWLIIVVCGILGGALGFAYAWFKKPIYTATTTFVLEEGDKAGGLGQYAGLASMVGIDLGGGGGGIFQGDNIIELYKSRSMVEKTLLTQVNVDGKGQLLIDIYLNMNKRRESWKENPQLSGLKFTKEISQNEKNTSKRLQDSVLGKAVEDINKNYLKVEKPDKSLSILEIKFKAPNEFFAKSFNDNIVQNVNDFYVQTKTKKSLENLAILEHQTDSVRNVLNGAIYQSAAVADATPNINPTRLVLRAPAQRSQFNAEANKLVLSELVKNLELSKLTLRKETPLIQIVDKPIFPLYTERLSEIAGTVIGGFLSIFFIIIYLLFQRYYRTIFK